MTRSHRIRIYNLFEATLAIAFVILAPTYVCAQGFSARLNGFEEIGPIPGPTAALTGSILSDGSATLRLDLDKNAKTITYTLKYSNVGTTAPLTGTVTQAHIHFGKFHVPGGILAFLCTNLGNGPAAAPPPPCPANSGTVTGTLTAASIVAIAGQNVRTMDFDALTDALASDTAYANIHTTALTAGEIRGQIEPVEKQEEQNRGG